MSRGLPALNLWLTCVLVADRHIARGNNRGDHQAHALIFKTQHAHVAELNDGLLLGFELTELSGEGVGALLVEQVSAMSGCGSVIIALKGLLALKHLPHERLVLGVDLKAHQGGLILKREQVAHINHALLCVDVALLNTNKGARAFHFHVDFDAP